MTPVVTSWLLGLLVLAVVMPAERVGQGLQTRYSPVPEANSEAGARLDESFDLGDYGEDGDPPVTDRNIRQEAIPLAPHVLDSSPTAPCGMDVVWLRRRLASVVLLL